MLLIKHVPFNSFLEHKQVLVSEQQKVVLYAVCFPEAGRLAVVLFFYDDFFCRKTCALKDAHRLKAERLHHSFASRVAHKDGAKLAFLQNAAAFACDLSHFR